MVGLGLTRITPGAAGVDVMAEGLGAGVTGAVYPLRMRCGAVTPGP